MPIYDWECAKCDKPFETVESITTYSGVGKCPTCGNESKERIFSSQIYFVGAKVEDAEYNPAFGKVVKNKRERNELAKEKGLIEIGNEKPETIHKEASRTLADNLNKGWDDL